jgi:uncharacterized protein (TIGR02594 family)
MATKSPAAKTVTSPVSPTRWLALARADLGVREVPGVANNPLLMRRFSAITKALGIAYNADSVPWCGAIMAWWMTQCGIKPPAIAVRAKAWAEFGVPLTAAQLAPGAVLVFGREGGGHVGLYVGEDASHYHVLGGNQGDAISIMRIMKGRCVARRWPAGEARPGGPVKLAASGAAASSNEA